jgi:peptidoglycan/LPS O-acetylase OafA/YrhL
MRYRGDVDGLRAVAVLPVVAFHAGWHLFGGGYVGVDVFFVISGYLITSIISEEIAEGRFTVAGFYERRVRRIFPALFFVIAASVLAAALILLPRPLKDFGQSLVATTLFSSNVLFWLKSGYFEVQSELRPLLHTWSLAVEEQFYIVFPLLLVAIKRWGGGRYARWLIPLVMASFAASLHATSTSPTAAFYLPQYRAWELLLGALLALRAVPAHPWQLGRETGAAAGLLLIGFGVFAFDQHTPFPGLAALAPCLGTALVIHAGSAGETVVGRLLAARPVVFVGKMSYSLYLWHWPALVFARHLKQAPLELWETLALVAGAFLFAWVSLRFVEQPFRKPPEGSSRARLFTVAGAMMAVAVFTGLFGHVTAGWQGRFPGYAPPQVRGREDYREGTCFLREDQSARDWAGAPACVLESPAAETALLWGDSFGAHLIPGLERARWPGARVALYTMSGCPPVFGAATPSRPGCPAFVGGVEEVIERLGVRTVILSARWEKYWGSGVDAGLLQATVDRLRRRGLDVVLVGQGPQFEFEQPYDYSFRRGTDVATSRRFGDLATALAGLGGLTLYFDPRSALCQGDRCAIRRDGEFTFVDWGHLSSRGSALVVDALLSRLDEARQKVLPGVVPAGASAGESR